MGEVTCGMKYKDKFLGKNIIKFELLVEHGNKDVQYLPTNT